MEYDSASNANNNHRVLHASWVLYYVTQRAEFNGVRIKSSLFIAITVMHVWLLWQNAQYHNQLFIMNIIVIIQGKYINIICNRQ